MSEWRYGRYFLLEGDVKLLFQWLNKHCGDNWSVDVLGVCPTESKLILNTVLHTENDLKLFQQDFIADQSLYSSVYNNRRKPEYKWPITAERRESSDRRSDKYRRHPKRLDTRRLEDVVRQAFIKKQSIFGDTLKEVKAL